MFVEAAAFTPLGHNGQVVLRHVAHEQQDVDMPCLPATKEEEEIAQEKKIQTEKPWLKPQQHCLGAISYLKTATSFLNA